MAQLKDLLVAGNARIIGESSFNKNITAKGNVTAAAFYGDGSHLTGFTANKVLVSDNSGAISTRDITNLTKSGGITASTNLVTANTLYYFTGTTNTTTVGTISSGIWQATVIGVSYGQTLQILNLGFSFNFKEPLIPNQLNIDRNDIKNLFLVLVLVIGCKSYLGYGFTKRPNLPNPFSPTI